MVALLEKAGRQAVRGLQDRSRAAREVPGTYKRGRQRADDRRGRRALTIGQAGAPPAQRLTLVATGEKAFKAIGAPITSRSRSTATRSPASTLTQGAIRTVLPA
jgi:hypothetical protein